MSPFFEALFRQHKTWRQLPVVERPGKGRLGFLLTVPSPSDSDLYQGLRIEDVDNEIIISLDYSHVHLEQPSTPQDVTGNIWSDANAVIDAILRDEIVSTSGWIDDKLRIASLHQIDIPPKLLVPNLQRLRVRSWTGRLDRDETLL